MKCKYIYKGHTFNSEIELDDFLIEKREYESKYGDLVFYRKKPMLRTLDIIDNKIKVDTARLDALYEEAKRKSKSLDGEIDYAFRAPYIGVNKWLASLRTEDGTRLFPEFTEEYWKDRFSKWTDPLRPDEKLYSDDKTGRFTKDEIEVFFPGDSFSEKLANARLLKSNPDLSKDEPTILKRLMEKKWEKQNLVGQALHFVMETYFSSFEQNGKTYKVRELANEPTKGLPGMRQYIIDKVQSEFKNELGRRWTDDLLPSEILDQMIVYADVVHSKMVQRFGDDCEFYPELRISGKIASTEQGAIDHLLGIIDLLVVDSKGQVHIFDYKTSTKEYKDFNSAKKLAFYYQLATYGKLLKRYGLEYRTATIGILPITLTNFQLENQEEALTNPELAKFRYYGVDYPDDIFKDITGQIFRMNRNMEQTIIKNLDDYLPEPVIKDAPSDQMGATISEQNAIWFPEYGKTKSEPEIKQMIEDTGGFEEKEIDGKKVFSWRPKGSFAKDIVADTEAQLYEKIKTAYTTLHRGRAQLTRRVADAIEKKQRGVETSLEELLENIDTNQVLDPSGKIDWFRKMILPYCNSDWEIYRNEHAENLGVIIVRNKINNQLINVIKMSNSYLGYNRHIGGKDKNTLVGAFASDISEKSNSNSLMLNAYNGNIELIEAMQVLNNIPSLFQGVYSGAIVGNIQVINSWQGEGMSATNEELLYCWKQLNKYSKLKVQDNISNGTVRFATTWQNALVEFNTAMANNNTFELENKKEYADCQSILDNCADTNVDEKIRQITKIIKTMEKHHPELSEMKGDMDDPKVALYNHMLTALASLRGINFRQQLKDHDKWLEDKTYKALGNGVTGTYLDNPGNLASETLNLITKQVMQGYQNVRYEMQDPVAKLRNLTEKLKAEKNFGWLQKRTQNQTSLYENMIEKGSDGDLYFTDINKLHGVEREYLHYVLMLINKNRTGHTNEQIEEGLKKHDLQYYRLPLAKAEFESRAYGSSLMDSLKERLQSFSPAKALEDMRNKTEGIFTETESYEKSESLFKMNNMFTQTDSRMRPKERIDFIALKGESFFEHNLEVLALKHAFAYSVQRNIDEVFPTIKAAMASLAMQGHSRNREFTQDREYLENYIKAKIKNQSIQKDDTAKGTEQTLSKIRQVASFLSLAFSPVQGLYQTMQGLWQDISLIIRKPDGTQAFTFKNMYNAAKIVYSEMFHYSDTPTKCQLINEMLGINDMDMNTYAEKMRTERHGVYNLWNFAFKFTSRPDFYNRMTIVVAKMMHEGVWDALEVKDRKLVYNFKKDGRFKAYANNLTGDPNYDKEKGLYLAMARQFVNEGLIKPDGEPFKVGDEFVYPYTNLESESTKDLCDLIYGYYSHEKKSMIHSTWLGALYMQMRTYWSGKKNQYLQPGGVRLRGKWEQAVDENGTPLFYQVQDGQVMYDEELTTENTGIPAVQWKGQWQEGVFMTLKTMLFDYGIGPDGWKEGWRATWGNEDDNIRTIRQSNIMQFGIDLTFFMLIGGLIGGLIMGDWDKELQKEAKNSGELGDAMFATAFHIMTMSMTQSASDFAWWSSIGGPTISWTPFSFEYGSRFLTRWWNVLTGDPTFYDGITGSFAAGKQMKPLLECIKPDSDE